MKLAWTLEGDCMGDRDPSAPTIARVENRSNELTVIV